ncbi:MAG TPA: ABC transporter transmembrane domain-containing protein, partial [Methylophilaceae bacterium]|nr:ABC transporter transmembrane domain-containing protein [Methylophilaceae bacterium]
MRYTARYWLVFVLSIAGLAILSATNTAFLATIKTVTDEGFVKQDSSQLFYLPLLLFGLLSLRAFAGSASGFGLRWVARHVVQDLRVDAFNKLIKLPVQFFDANSAGVLTSKITYDADQMSKAATSATMTLVRDTLTIIRMLGYMFYLDWQLTLIFILVTPPMALYLRRMTPKLRAAGRSAQETVGGMTKVLEEAISGQRIVKIFGGEEYESQRFEKVVKRNRQMLVRLARISAFNTLVVEMLAAVALGMVVYYAVGSFTAGEFAAFVGA